MVRQGQPRLRPSAWSASAHRRTGVQVPDQGTPRQGRDPGTGPSKASVALRSDGLHGPSRALIRAVSGPSGAARQWPMTTNDDRQAGEPTALEQAIPSSPRSPTRPRAGSSRPARRCGGPPPHRRAVAPAGVGQPHWPPHEQGEPDWQPQLHPEPQPHAPSSTSRRTVGEVRASGWASAAGSAEDAGESAMVPPLRCGMPAPIAGLRRRAHQGRTDARRTPDRGVPRTGSAPARPHRSAPHRSARRSLASRPRRLAFGLRPRRPVSSGRPRSQRSSSDRCCNSGQCSRSMGFGYRR